MDLTKEKFDILIQAGQSNAEGMGLGPVLKEYVSSEKVLYLSAEKEVTILQNGLKIDYADKPFSIELAKERCVDGKQYGDFALTFSEEYIKNGLLKEDKKMLIVRAAVGGTGFYKKQWGVGNILHSKMIEMVEYALSLNPENRVVGFLWHQGEHDAFEGNKPEIYHKQLTDMINDVRFRYGNMPFIAGDFVNEWKSKNLDSCEPIVNVIRMVVKECGYAGFVETADLLSNNQKTGNGDDIHFCRQALHVLGRRYFDMYNLIKG
ncbi:MAG: sialate O-acetylesterase [Clostridiales bacterium]|nr:sialate O-acetylesterase [Clostridiales bacterium]